MSDENTMKEPTDPLTTMKVPIRRGVENMDLFPVFRLHGSDGEAVGVVSVSDAGVLEVKLHGRRLRVHAADILCALNDGIDGVLTNMSAEDMREVLDSMETQEGGL
jgi:hypothetical protein